MSENRRPGNRTNFPTLAAVAEPRIQLFALRSDHPAILQISNSFASANACDNLPGWLMRPNQTALLAVTTPAQRSTTLPRRAHANKRRPPAVMVQLATTTFLRSIGSPFNTSACKPPAPITFGKVQPGKRQKPFTRARRQHQILKHQFANAARCFR